MTDEMLSNVEKEYGTEVTNEWIYVGRTHYALSTQATQILRNLYTLWN